MNFISKRKNTNSLSRIVRKLFKKIFFKFFGKDLKELSFQFSELLKQTSAFASALIKKHGLASGLFAIFLAHTSLLQAQSITYSQKSITEYSSKSKAFTVMPILNNYGYQQTRIAVNDVDDDGNVDVFFGSDNDLEQYEISSGEFTRKTTDGAFKTAKDNSDLTSPSLAAIALGDVDNDGDLDAIVFDSSGGEFKFKYFAQQNTSDQFIATANSADQITGIPSSYYVDLDFIDFDDDGDQDLIASVYSGESGGEFYVHKNENGQISTDSTTESFFTELSSFIVSEYDSAYHAISVTDFDNDGDQDVIAWTASSNRFFYFENDGGSLKSKVELTNSAFKYVFFNDGYTFSNDIAFVDLDSDGDKDLIHGVNRSYYGLVVYENVDGVFYNQSFLRESSNSNSTLFDLDSDGDLDLISTTTYVEIGDGGYYSYTQVYDKLGSTFTGNSGFKLSDNTANDDLTTVKFGNIDGDDRLDSIMIETNSESSNGFIKSFTAVDDVLLSNENISLVVSGDAAVEGRINLSASDNTGINHSNSVFFDLIDLDNDGDSDLLVGDYDGYIKRYNNDGTGNFQIVRPSSTEYYLDDVVKSGFYEARIGSADLDLDGDEDLVIIGDNEAGDGQLESIAILINNSGDFESIDISSSNFSNLESNINKTNVLDIALGDVNDDGIADLIYTRKNTRDIFVLESSYSGDFKAENSKLKSASSFSGTQSGEMTFTWSDDSAFTNPEYTFQLSTDENFGSDVYAQTTDQLTVTVNPGVVLTNDVASLFIDWNNFNPNQLIAADDKTVVTNNWQTTFLYYLAVLMILFAFTYPASKKGRKALLALIASLFLIVAGCSGDDDSDDSDDSSSSDSGTTYYWRVVASEGVNSLTSPTESFDYE